MKKDTLIKSIVVMLVVGVLLGVAFFSFSDASIFCPVPKGAQIVSFDEAKDPVGTLSFSETQIKLYEKASYSDLSDGASVEKGNGIGKKGVNYIKVFHNNIKTLLENNITITTQDDLREYKFKGRYEAKSEYSLLLKDAGVSNGIVLYYQKSTGIGFSDNYEALIYEEVR